MRNITIHKQFLSILAVSLVGSALTSPLHAQTFFGSIVGTATDATGAVLPGATVTIQNVSTNEQHTAATNSAGEYSFVSLVPATYTVDVQKGGFKRFLRSQVTVEVNQTVRVYAVLQIGSASETVEVSTQTPQLQTDSATLSTVVEGKTIDQMPLNGRNTMNLIALAPGVVPTNNSGGGAAMGVGSRTTATNWSAFSIGGGIIGQNAMFLDGMPLNYLGSAAIEFVPTQDAIQEFSVQASASSSEFGRYSGGVVNMTTKSGTNTLHGTAYEYVRNQILNANEFFNKAAEMAAGTANKPTQWNQNQYGAAIEGPLKRDKLFGMFSWEAFTARIASLQSRNVPTPDMGAGWIAGQGANIAKFTGQCPAATVGTSPSGVANSVNIPKSCWDPTSAIMLTEWPSETNINTTNNFQKVTSSGSDTANFIGRIDYSLSEKQRMFGRVAVAHLQDRSQQWMPGGVYNGTPWNIGGGQTVNRAIAGVLGDTYTINPTTILDVRFSISRLFNGQDTPTHGMNLGIFGTNWAALQKQMTLTNIPVIAVSGDAFSPTGFLNAGQISSQWNDNDSIIIGLTKILGRHSFKFGGETRFMDRYVLSESGATLSASGQFTFSNAYFTGSGWANYLLGLTTNVYQSNVREVASYNWYQGYYGNDTWQATPRLTVIAGLRWELPGNIKEKHDNSIALMPNLTDPTTGVYGTAGLVNSSLYHDRGSEPARHDLFAPNVGFAYRVTDNDVVRAGYSYVVAPIDIAAGLFPENYTLNSYLNSYDYGSTGITHPLSNPFPGGLGQPISRSAFSTASLLKTNLVAPLATSKYPYTQQWNLVVSHQFSAGLVMQVGYAGAKATHLPMTYAYNELSPAYWSDPTLPLLASSGATGTLSSAQIGTCTAVWGTAISLGQCARPHSGYLNFNDAVGPYGFLNYQSMPVMVQKRFKTAGLVMASYTWAKSLGNTGGGTGSAQSPGGTVQNWYNLAGEKSVTASDIRNRLVLSYVLNLPFGKGGAFLSHVTNPLASRLISGWAVNGITTFQTGFPTTLYANEPSGVVNIPSTYGSGNLRPNYAAGCAKKAGGSWKSHVLSATPVINTACWSAPPVAYTIGTKGYATTLGNEPRIDGGVLAPGYNNWDLSLQKLTSLTERVSLEFRAEYFNAFNHVRFGAPLATVNSNGFGTINSSSTGENQPRLGQLSLRANF